MSKEVKYLPEEEGISRIFDTLGYETAFDFESLPDKFDLADIDANLPTAISKLLRKIATEDDRETGFMVKIQNHELISSDIQMGTDDGEHIRFDLDDFLKLYRIDGNRKREKLLYDIHTHEVADIGPSPRDLTNLFKEMRIFGAHFSLVLTATKAYLMVRTKQTPSLKQLDAIKHVGEIQRDYQARFATEVRNRPNFVATNRNKNELLAKINSEWLPEVCDQNQIGLFEIDMSGYEDGEDLVLTKK